MAITEARERHRRAVEVVIEVVAAIRATYESAVDPEFLSVVRAVYWGWAEVPSGQLAKAAGFRHPNDLVEAIGPIRSGERCPGCGDELMRTSRSWTPGDCKACRKARADGWARQWRVQDARREHVESGKVMASAGSWRSVVRMVLSRPPVVATGGGDVWDGYEVAERLSAKVARFGDEQEVPVRLVDAELVLSVARQVVEWSSRRGPAADVVQRLWGVLEVTRDRLKAEAVELFPDEVPVG